MKSDKLTINLDLLNTLSDTYGDSFFLFDSQKLQVNLAELKSSFQTLYNNFTMAYSYKTNYVPLIIKQIIDSGVHSEVVSQMEYDLAKLLKVDSKHIIFNGPVKSVETLKMIARDKVQLNLDSLVEINNLISIVDDLNGLDPLKVGIRCNLRLDEISSSRFGIDVESEDFSKAVRKIQQNPHLRLSGLHCHLPNRDLKSVVDRVSKLVEVAKQTFVNVPDFLNIGGGFYGKELTSLTKDEIPTFGDYAKSVTEIIKKSYPDSSKQPKLIIEPGTSLVANCLTYWTKIVSTKKIGENHIAVSSGSIFECSPNGRVPRKPTYLLSKSVFSEYNKWNIVGYTCVESDVLSSEFEADLNVGDYVGYGNVGSYSIVMKPPFISPASPILEILPNSNKIRIMREPQKLNEIFASYKFEDK
jgi:diaminopimelate decarboxylase